MTRRRQRWPRLPERGDDVGSLTAFAVLVLVALMALVGLVVDGGTALSARQAAADEAQQAARAGAAALSVSGLRSGVLTIDPTRAVAAAQAFMLAAGHPGSVTVEGRDVRVDVSYRVPTAVLGMVGITSFPVSAEATATDVQGVASGSP